MKQQRFDCSFNQNLLSAVRKIPLKNSLDVLTSAEGILGFFGVVLSTADIENTDIIGFKTRVKNNFQEILSDTGDSKTLIAEASTRIFKDCTTASCVEKISDDYQIWMAKTLDFNRSIDLGHHIVLHKIPTVRERKVKKMKKKVTYFYFFYECNPSFFVSCLCRSEVRKSEW